LAAHPTDLLMILPIIQTGFSPELAGDLERIDSSISPPCSLVACAMNRAVMPAAERYHKLVAHLAAERARLRESEMMRVGGFAGADQAGLRGDEPQMLPVAITFWLGEREDALVDARRVIIGGQYFGNRLRRCPDLVVALIAVHWLPNGIGLGEL
jgi:hypothetical protein